MSNISFIGDSYPVEWLFFGKDENNLFHKKVSSKDAGCHGRVFDKEKAIEEFRKRFNFKPVLIRGPIRDGKIISFKNIEGSLDKDSMVFTKERFKCQYKNWKGIAHIVNDSSGREAALFFFMSYVSNDPFIKKTKPKPRIVPLSSLF